MKKMTQLLMALTLSGLVLFSGCSKPAATPVEPAKELVKVGMATDSGTIDDKSFNQGTWEGILKYQKDTGAIESKYLQPTGEQQTDYVNAINDLVDSGYKIIVTPGIQI